MISLTTCTPSLHNRRFG